MIIELLVFINEPGKDAPNLNDLALLTEDFSINDAHETIEFVIRVISNRKRVLALVKRRARETRSSSYIVISDQLVAKSTMFDGYQGSALYYDIGKQLRHTKSFCGLIGIFPDAVPDCDTIEEIGIDEYATFTHRDMPLLRQKLLTVARRIWLKSPVSYRQPHGVGSVNSIEIVPVSRKADLEECLKLRGQVYESLGYVSKASADGTEKDFYDPVSFHFRAVDREQEDRTIGTMRLIVPGLSGFGRHAKMRLPNPRWFDNIPDKGQLPSLPVFQSFQHFRDPEKHTIEENESIRSRNVCEVSRVIVLPEYRGMGVSKLLMNHAIAVGRQLRRKYLWLECAPHHIDMYSKFDFQLKRHAGGCFYERVQRFDTWAVAMYLELEGQNEQLTGLNESSATCYYLPITKGRAENCALRFQYFDKPVDKIKNVFENPLSELDSSMPLRELIPSTLTSLDIERFVRCLKQVFDDDELEPNKLSFISKNGRNHVFNNTDIKSGDRGQIETRIYQWLG